MRMDGKTVGLLALLGLVASACASTTPEPKLDTYGTCALGASSQLPATESAAGATTVFATFIFGDSQRTQAETAPLRAAAKSDCLQRIGKWTDQVDTNLTKGSVGRCSQGWNVKDGYPAQVDLRFYMDGDAGKLKTLCEARAPVTPNGSWTWISY